MLIPSFLFGKYPDAKKACAKVVTRIKKGEKISEIVNGNYRDAAKEKSAIIIENLWNTNSHLEGFWMFPLADALWKAEREGKINFEKVFNELIEEAWGHLAISCGQHCYWMFPKENPARGDLYLENFVKHMDAYFSIDGQLERQSNDPVTEKNYFKGYAFFSGTHHILNKILEGIEKCGYRKFLVENNFVEKAEVFSGKIFIPEIFFGTFDEVQMKIQSQKNRIHAGESIEKLFEEKMIDVIESGERVIGQDARGQERAQREHFYLCPLYILLREGDWGGRDAFVESLLNSPWGTLCSSINGGYWIHSNEKLYNKMLLQAIARYSDAFQNLSEQWSWEDETAEHWLYKNCIPHDIRSLIARIIHQEIRENGFLPIMKKYRVI